MGINEWWSDDPAERYWMEITDRTDLGSDLHAPQVDDAGREYWSYALVTAVQPGDVVLHWHKSLLGSPGIVGYSIAAEGPEADEIVWASQGSYGRNRAASGPEPAWRYALTGYTPLARPVNQDAFRRVEERLRRIKERLEVHHPGSLYFPFAFSDKRPVRAAQGYLVKLPAEVISAVPELMQIPRVGDGRVPRPRPASSELAVAARKRRGAGYMRDEVVRLAIERHAVDWVLSHYSSQGYDVTDVGATKSYDVLALSDQGELHIEVKGSSGDADTVELTANEVQHAAEASTHLVVVDCIDWRRLPDGTVETSGGRVRVWESWVPAEKALKPTRYRYRLPSGGKRRYVE
ncbi:protein NO VEIN domain-containing protein [Micromonospora sp. CA-248260]|uniref:protein NO VEIN domain-containing protein n=1 Tax=Micromonospora sp. CA-248260 TaxID=3239962 RepID=UPI003D8CFBBD